VLQTAAEDGTNPHRIGRSSPMDPEVRDGWIEELFLICFRSSTLWFYPTKNNDKYLYLVVSPLPPYAIISKIL
jgi:hypothetical protein